MNASLIAIAVLTVASAGAQAAELDPITVSPPVVQPEGRDMFTEVPIEDVTVDAHIAVDTETLRNDSGVVLLRDRVLEAAQKACAAADRAVEEDSACVHDAVKAAEPQVTAAIAAARDSSAS